MARYALIAMDAAAGTAQQHDRALALAEDRCIWREVDGEVIVLDKRTWSYLAVNGSGTPLWKMLSTGATRTQMIERLVESFGIDAQTASRDTDAFIAMLSAHSLLDSAVSEATRQR